MAAASGPGAGATSCWRRRRVPAPRLEHLLPAGLRHRCRLLLSKVRHHGRALHPGEGWRQDRLLRRRALELVRQQRSFVGQISQRWLSLWGLCTSHGLHRLGLADQRCQGGIHKVLRRQLHLHRQLHSLQMWGGGGVVKKNRHHNQHLLLCPVIVPWCPAVSRGAPWPTRKQRHAQEHLQDGLTNEMKRCGRRCLPYQYARV